MSLQDIVNISITFDSVGVQQAGFGVPLILAVNAAWVERVRFYTSTSGVLADFAVTTPEYRAAEKIFAQEPKPSRIAIGRRALKPTQRYKITVASVLNLTLYQVRVGANTAGFTSDASATNDEIVAGLVAAINLLVGDTTTASVQGIGPNTYVQCLANAAGNFDAVEVLDVSLLGIAQDHADPGLATDLAAIKLYNNEWYFLINLFNSKAEIEACALFAEANEKIFVAATVDTDNITLAVGPDVTSPMKSLFTSAYARSAPIYHPKVDAFTDAAWVGRVAPFDPGSETWKFKTLATVPAVVMTATHQTNVNAKNGNHYQLVAGVNITAEGKVSAGEFIDVIRFRDWLKARMSERIFAHLAAAKKIPYTDEGIAVIEGDVRAQLLEGVAVGGLSNDPAPVVQVPRAADVAPADKTARILRNVKFSATLAGAIHAVEISGVVSV